MPRHARIVLPGLPHHVTQRGNYRQEVFQGDSDYAAYCALVNRYSTHWGFETVAFCLMPNHVHFIAVPSEPDSFAQMLRVLQMRHAQYMNKHRGIQGHLWHSRFYSCLLGETHLYRAIRYVEANPVRAKLVSTPWDYKWSSARARVGFKSPINLAVPKAVGGGFDWKTFLQGADAEMCDAMRQRTARGLPVGAPAFLETMERKFGRPLLVRGPGRPRRS
jgi:putative transposase